jgi:hypothetical protein
MGLQKKTSGLTLLLPHLAVQLVGIDRFQVLDAVVGPERIVKGREFVQGILDVRLLAGKRD